MRMTQGKECFELGLPNCERSMGKNRMVNLRDARAGFASIQEIVMIVLVALWELVEWYPSASRGIFERNSRIRRGNFELNCRVWKVTSICNCFVSMPDFFFLIWRALNTAGMVFSNLGATIWHFGVRNKV